MPTIVTKNSSTAGAAPLAANLQKGELAVNVTDQILYTENNAGSVVRVSPPMRLIGSANPKSGTSVNFTLPAYGCSQLVIVFDAVTAGGSTSWTISFQSGTASTIATSTTTALGVVEVFNTNITGNKVISARLGTTGLTAINTSMTGTATSITISVGMAFPLANTGTIYLYGID